MKSFKLIVVALCLFIAGNVGAQISVGLSIGTPPLWGPVGYSDARYYYLPDVDAYYDINASTFIYLDGGNWVHHRELPGRYAHYDLDHGYKVVLSGYHGNTPYTMYGDHRQRYGHGYRGAPQRTYREDRDHGHDNGHREEHHEDHDKGHGGGEHGGKGRK